MRVISLGRLISHHWALSRLMGPEQAVGRTVKAISAISQEASAGRGGWRSQQGNPPLLKSSHHCLAISNLKD